MSFALQMAAISVALVRALTLRKYPGPRLGWFSIYLAVNLAEGAVLSFLNQNGRAYAYAWIAVEPLNALLWVAMAVELYAYVSELYPGMSKPGWALLAIGTGIGINVLTMIEPHVKLMQQTYLLRRSTATVLALAIALLAALFGYFKNSIPANLVRHGLVMAGYFCTQAVPYFLTNLKGRNGKWDLLGIWGAFVCYLLWAILLTPAGQNRPEFDRGLTDVELETIDEKVDAAIQSAKSIATEPQSKPD